MKAAEKFWIHVGNALEKEVGPKHPSTWTPKEIEDFLLNKFRSKLTRRCYNLGLNRYKYESSVERFLIGLLDTEKRKNFSSFEKCQQMLGYLGGDKMGEAALGNKLLTYFENNFN